MKKLFLALVFWGAVLCTPVFAKTFVGVLWPMFGPLPAIGLVELVAELKLMPDVEVSTYLHQNWPALVEDLERQPPGTRTVVVGYSLGANSSVFVANQAKYIDVIIALQPSMLSWNPEVTGQVGRMIEVYNPNPSMTFGGMGSKKLIGPNIEYIANNDSHPGAQFSSEFRNLVKSEIVRVSAEPAVEAAEAPVQAPLPVPRPANIPGPKKLAALKRQSSSREPTDEQRRGSGPQSEYATAFLDNLTSSVDSGNLFAQRQLTVTDMRDYATRNYRNARTAELLPTDAKYK
jgi:predicted alpha/beta hydrolase family esterase